MSLIEAEELLSFIQIDHAVGKVALRQLGNKRDYVLIVRETAFFVWGLDDWLQYRQREEDSVLARWQDAQKVS